MADGEEQRKNGDENPLLNQIRNRTYSLHHQQFAEIYIEEKHPAPQESSVSEPIRTRSPEEENIFLLFQEMRRLYRYPPYVNPLGENESFYRQAKKMEHFEDDYSGNAPFSAYFPEYQIMSYEQLRTYFTWRTCVRRGSVKKTCFSYVFLYIYELINNIGVTDGREGLSRLLSIWREYVPYERKLGAYMAEWVKDYYIINAFEFPFFDLVRGEPLLQEYYPFPEETDFFDLYAKLSSYPFERSAFYTAETERDLRNCFEFVVGKLDGWLRENGACFDDLINYDGKPAPWVPFRKARYAPQCMPPPERKEVRISGEERYWYENGRWFCSARRIGRTSGRRIIGYLFKRIEQFYRKTRKYKYRLNADKTKLDLSQIREFFPDPKLFFEKIDGAILEFHREAHKRSVNVDPGRLEKIRESASSIQEKLLAPLEESEAGVDAFPEDDGNGPNAESISQAAAAVEKNASDETGQPLSAADGWEKLAHSLTETEKEALRLLLRGTGPGELQEFCRARLLMPEVLAEKINEKAVEAVEDNILELADTASVYEEYRCELERVVLNETE